MLPIFELTDPNELERTNFGLVFSLSWYFVVKTVQAFLLVLVPSVNILVVINKPKGTIFFRKSALACLVKEMFPYDQ